MPSQNSMAESFLSVQRLGSGKEAILRKCKEKFITRHPNASGGGDKLLVEDREFSDCRSSQNGSWQVVKSNSLCSFASSCDSADDIHADIGDYQSFQIDAEYKSFQSGYPTESMEYVATRAGAAENPLLSMSSFRRNPVCDKEQSTINVESKQPVETATENETRDDFSTIREELFKVFVETATESESRDQFSTIREEILKNLDLHDQEMAAKKKLNEERAAKNKLDEELDELMEKLEKQRKVAEKTTQSTSNEIAGSPLEGADELTKSFFDYAELDKVMMPAVYVPASFTTIQQFLDDEGVPDPIKQYSKAHLISC